MERIVAMDARAFSDKAFAKVTCTRVALKKTTQSTKTNAISVAIVA